MLNINNKRWFELNNEDVGTFLKAFTGEVDNDENFFFEFKDADVKNQKITNEVCAFANTYGGYIFIGVSDNKDIVGCGEWSEERIQNLICDSITPLPSYDIRKFIIDGKSLVIVKVDEGSRPPYITNKGEIFERVSSGCRKLVNSDRLSAIYRKTQEQQTRIEQRLKFEPINIQRKDFPNNIVAIVDMGFEIITNDYLNFYKDFFSYKLDDILDKFSEEGISSLFRVGNTLVASYGNVTRNSGNEESEIMLQAGINNCMVIYPDGAVKTRCILIAKEDDSVKIDTVISSMSAYRGLYEFLFPDLWGKFVYASKYEQLNVIKSFRPDFSAGLMESFEKWPQFRERKLQMGNIIFTGCRIPSYGYLQIDKKLFDQLGDEYTEEVLFDELFHSSYSFMGMI
ncbi:MAG: ATP-binding protein [Butyrivibrio sp.]|uniref:AlbA family DNA-binding domain-containing protein n=1 Tax=Butyrivibrio sp. TaxID=28121 RepID=UPI0025CBC9BD|nr:ATP-binding protein [Butyrivibrio sp.]MCR5771422.1 ATP-binding protein [Butyrivibrio sp.]